MKKLLLAMAVASIVSIPAAAAASETEIPVGGTFGLPDCWVRFYVADVTVTTTYPYVWIYQTGNPGPEVHCPLT